MKYIIVIGDGMADIPIQELDFKTILQYANKPTMNYLAKNGKTGLAITVPDGYTPGSDVANMSIFGYDPTVYYTGRSPLEAVSMGIQLNSGDIAFRCNLISLDFNNNIRDSTIIDYSGGHISPEESHILISYLSSSLDKKFTDIVSFYSGVGYRNLMVSHNNYGDDLKCIPPHDIIDKKINNYLPIGINQDFFIDLTKRSYDLLASHPINIERVKNGKLPANCIWLWGQGIIPKLISFYDLYHKHASVISAVDLLKGLGICSQMSIINVPNVTGFLDTNYSGKVFHALKSLEKNDVVFIHVEAPDECGHMGDVAKKIKAVEDIDQYILKPLLNHIKTDKCETYRILVLPDHPTPVSLRTHTSNPVPFLIYDSRECYLDTVSVFDETSVLNGSYGIIKAFNLMNLLFKENLN